MGPQKGKNNVDRHHRNQLSDGCWQETSITPAGEPYVLNLTLPIRSNSTVGFQFCKGVTYNEFEL